MTKLNSPDSEMPSDVLIQAFQDCVPTSESADKAGLLIIDIPTGGGKTYAAIEYLARFSLDPNNRDRKIIFLAGQKKHLPKKEDLIRAFDRLGVPDPDKCFDEKVLIAVAHKDSVKERWDEVSKLIPKELKKTEYNDLKEVLELLQESSTDPFGGHDDIVTIMDGELEKLERNFRSYLNNELKRDYAAYRVEQEDKKYRSLSDFVATERKWFWLPKLYPVAQTREKQILIMTLDKFISPYATILEPAFYLYQSDLVEDAVVFIDEIDSSKEVLLKHFIENDVDNPLDPVSIIKGVHTQLNGAIPAELEMVPQVKIVFEKNKAKINDIFNTYRLDLDFMLQADSPMEQELFYVNEKISSIDKKCWVHADLQEKRNIITLSSEKVETPGWHSLFTVAKDMYSVLTYLCNGLNSCAETYRREKNKIKNDRLQADLTESDSIHSLLYWLRVNEEKQRKSMEERIRVARKVFERHRYKEIKDSMDATIYCKGPEFIRLTRDNRRALTDRIEFFSMPETPERWLTKLARNAFVVGLSATASLDSVACNYDLAYVKHCLGLKSLGLPKKYQKRLKASFDQRYAAYDNINIVTELAPSELQKALNELSETNDLGDCLKDFIVKKVSGKVSLDNTTRQNYLIERYLRVSWAYAQFLKIRESHQVRSMLFLTSPAPKKNSNSFDRDIIDSCLSMVYEVFVGPCDADQVDSDSCAPFVHYCEGSKSYDSDFARVQEDLEGGASAFFIASYQTIGTGVNLQYKVPDGIKTVQIYEKPSSEDYKDFDAIFLDRISYLDPIEARLASSRDSSGERDNTGRERRKNVWELIYLVEALAYRGEVSSKKKRSLIKKILKYDTGCAVYNIWDNEKPESIATKGTKTLIQALGRMGRTNYKAQNIFIYASQDLVSTVNLDAVNGRIVNKEFLLLKEKFTEHKGETESTRLVGRNKVYMIESRSQDMARWVRDQVKCSEWSKSQREDWRLIRGYLLKQPRKTGQHELPMHIEGTEGLTAYTYTTNHDFRDLSICLKEGQDELVEGLIPTGDPGKEVSEAASRLPQFMEIPGLISYFESKGYATQWDSSGWLMNPVAFQMFYLGALGEVAGRYLFERFLPYSLEEISDGKIFEKFDFKLENQEVYIDFKNWKSLMQGDQVKGLNCVMKKLEQIEKITGQPARGIICNVLATDEPEYRIQSFGNNKILSIPWLFDPKNPKETEARFRDVYAWIREEGA